MTFLAANMADIKQKQQEKQAIQVADSANRILDVAEREDLDVKNDDGSVSVEGDTYKVFRKDNKITIDKKNEESRVVQDSGNIVENKGVTQKDAEIFEEMANKMEQHEQHQINQRKAQQRKSKEPEL